MTVLSYPTAYDEREYSNLWCGQAVIADWATDWLGRVVLPNEVNGVIPLSQKGTFGTTTLGLVVAARALGLPVSDPIYGVPMSTYWPLANAAGHRVIVLHQCNGYAQPVPVGSTGIAHFRDGFGIDACNVATMNPWGGINESIGRGNMQAADKQEHIELMGVMPKDRANPPAPPQTVSENGMIIASTDSPAGKVLFVAYDIDVNGLLISNRCVDIGTLSPWSTVVAGQWLRISGAAYVPGGQLTLTPNASAFISAVGLDHHNYYLHQDLVTGQVWGPNADPNSALLKG